MESNIRMSGFVYILTNECMPGLVKIGSTQQDPVERARTLSNTSVPFPFNVAFAVDDQVQTLSATLMI